MREAAVRSGCAEVAYRSGKGAVLGTVSAGDRNEMMGPDRKLWGDVWWSWRGCWRLGWGAVCR